MFNIRDSECPVCRAPKMKIVEAKLSGDSILTRNEGWWYIPSVNEVIVEGFCTECGVKFITND